MRVEQWVIVIAWILTLGAALSFVVIYGPPWRYRHDKGMAWYVSLLTTANALEVVALMLARTTLVPAAIMYSVTACLMIVRLMFLIRSKRAIRREGRVAEEPLDG